MGKLTANQIHELSVAIDDFVENLKRDYRSTLMNLVEKSYKDGIKHAEKSVGQLSRINERRVADTQSDVKKMVNDRLIPVIDTYKRDLINTVKDCIKSGMTYKQTLRALDERLQYLETHIPFNSVGKTYTKPTVVNGKLINTKHTVTKPKTMDTSRYFDLLSQEISKRAYLMSKTYGFVSKGYNACKYVTKKDNRVRPEHKAMNGKVAKIGSPEFEGFVSLQTEYGCRCDIIPAKK